MKGFFKCGIYMEQNMIQPLIMLNIRSHIQKATDCMTPFISSNQRRQIYKDRKCISSVQGLEEEERRGSECEWIRGLFGGL